MKQVKRAPAKLRNASKARTQLTACGADELTACGADELTACGADAARPAAGTQRTAAITAHMPPLPHRVPSPTAQATSVWGLKLLVYGALSY